MNTLVLTAENANLPIAFLLEKVDNGSVEVRNAEGVIVAFVMSPADHQAWMYAEANLDLDKHREQIEAALQRRGGVTTAELLAKAAAAAERQGP
jgi:hypothetical protein